MSEDKFSAQRQFLVKLAGIDGYFATAEGGGKAADVSREYDGGSLTPELQAGPAIPDVLTIGRGFKPIRDGEVLARCDRECGSWTTTATIQPTDKDLVPIGRARTATVLLQKYSPPSVDANSGETARYSMEWAVSDVR